ncbi:uncharacterized protein B0I36DRAFT_367208 [Microdochium trichocladiopsis]|uniref:Uncharacterized protein n=1 Tax=Microdochium trichocladiopsis TaxID=1682393 RepID=A0A9P8XY68_9PEZI|nr:uncharacterized protein B0I36DRAFT_367208 [Microdochium trichocladiopsis]KAH7020723.1 hypothetical protein B0I36DRAFT_367208 [Microdochium trichocladiopsis]
MLYTIAAAAAAALAFTASTTLAASDPYHPDWITPNPSPDIQGTVHFPGRRLDRPWPGTWDESDTPSQWTLRLNISQQRRKWYPTFTTGEEKYTSIAAEIIPPAADMPGSFGTGSNITSSWLLSLVAVSPPGARTLSQGNDVENGTCPGSLISEECVAALKDRYRNDPNVTHGQGGPKPGAGCGVFAAASTTELSWGSGFTRSATTVWQLDRTTTEFDPYDVYGARTFPFVLVWGYQSPAVREGLALPRDHIQILCVKADTKYLAGGAAMPKGDASRPRAAGGATTMWLVMCLAVSLGLYIG